MSSSESSGAAAEATATTPAPSAEFPTFGSTRGSGLARGKRPSATAAASTAAAPSNYTPTAIEVVNAPREYTNPFAPADAAPAAEAPAAVVPPAPLVDASSTAPAKMETARVVSAPAAFSAPVAEESAPELNILPPAEQRTAPAQTWESDGFAPARESRGDRPRRESRHDEPRREEFRRDEPRHEESVDVASIPEKFLYVRPGVTYVPTPRNWGGAPRERSNRPAGENSPARAESPRSFESGSSTAAPAKSGGIFGWLKSFFGGSSSAEPAAAGASGGPRHENGERSHRGGRNRGGRGGEGGGHRRSRGGRGRSRSGGGGYPPPEGSSQGGI